MSTSIESLKQPRVLLKITQTELNQMINALQKLEVNGEMPLLDDLLTIKSTMQEREKVHYTDAAKEVQGPMYCETCD